MITDISDDAITALLIDLHGIAHARHHIYGLPLYGPMNAGHRERLEKVVEEWCAAGKAECQR